MLQGQASAYLVLFNAIIFWSVFFLSSVVCLHLRQEMLIMRSRDFVLHVAKKNEQKTGREDTCITIHTFDTIVCYTTSIIIDQFLKMHNVFYTLAFNRRYTLPKPSIKLKPEMYYYLNLNLHVFDFKVTDCITAWIRMRRQVNQSDQSCYIVTFRC